MGQRGPAPTPTNLKLLHGETRPSRIGSGEPQPREALPEAPGWLDDDARLAWERIVPELQAMGLAYAADTDALVVYCTAVANYSRAQRLLDRSGVLVRGHHGGLVRNPAHTVITQTAMVIQRFGRELGLTPAARVGLTSSPPEPEDARALAARLLS